MRPAKGLGMKCRDVGLAAIVFLLVALSINPGTAIANPYLVKPGEPTVRARIGACAVTGGFIHLYSALDNRLFEKYGINPESIVVRGGGVALAALASDEINFLYCNADANIVRIGTGADGTGTLGNGSGSRVGGEHGGIGRGAETPPASGDRELGAV